MASIKSLHLWLPDLPSSQGGIQMFSRHLLEALQNSGSIEKLRVVVKNGRAMPATSSNERVQFHTAGRWPRPIRTAAFAALAATWAARDRPDLIVTVHAHFSPLAALIK